MSAHGLQDLHEPGSYYVTQPLLRSGYTRTREGLEIYDAVWGKCNIGNQPGDEILLELFDNPLVRRLASISQLTLDPSFETMPNVSDMSRWEHAWGSLALVRAMSKKAGIPKEDWLELELRTFLSDVGHTAFSHLGDWIFQGVGGPEDQHDMDLPDLLEAGGVNDILRKHGISPGDVISEDTNDWIECPQPGLNVDRVDYGTRQIKRCFNIGLAVTMATRTEAFQVDDRQRLVMTSEKRARSFAKAFALLSTEHFGEPVHRLQLLLMQELTKRVFVIDEPLSSNGMRGAGEYHPRDHMYTVDRDILAATTTVDPFSWAITEIMRDTGHSQRRIFTQIRNDELAHWFETNDPKFPVPGRGKTWSSRYHPGYASNVEIIPVDECADVSDFGKNPHTLDFELQPLKPRAVDPLFVDKSGDIVRLSDRDPSFAKTLVQQATISQTRYVARLLVAPDYKTILQDGINQNSVEWERLLDRPRMPKEKLNELLKNAAGRLTSRLVEIKDHRLDF